MINHAIAKCIASNQLELIIFPTEKCNFRCTYCYEDFKIGKMKAVVIEAIKQLMTRRVEAGLARLSLSWFGGEPLLAKEVVYQLSEFAKELTQQYSYFQYQGSMTTNAYLLDADTLNRLISAGVNTYQISLDGDEISHNSTRPLANGKGTFETIWNNLLSAKASQHQFSMVLRLHITPSNIEPMKNLICKINETFAQDSRFKLFFKAIENLGGANSVNIQTLKSQDKKNILEALMTHVHPNIPIENKTQQAPHICYAASANSFIIRADGRLGKCTVALDDNRNTIGHLTPDGTLAIDAPKLSPWMRGLSTLNPTELSCPLWGM